MRLLPSFSVHSSICSNTDWVIGNIIAVVAVLLINIEINQVETMKPSIILQVQYDIGEVIIHVVCYDTCSMFLIHVVCFDTCSMF